jgi:hypothetical protein
MRNGDFALQHGGCLVTRARTLATGLKAGPGLAILTENEFSSIIPGPRRLTSDAASSSPAPSIVNVRGICREPGFMPAGSYLNP